MTTLNISVLDSVIKVQEWSAEQEWVLIREEEKIKIIGSGLLDYDQIGKIQMLKQRALILKAWIDGEAPIECRIFYLTDRFTQSGYFITLGLIQE